jgi:hypothetical protein
MKHCDREGAQQEDVTSLPGPSPCDLAQQGRCIHCMRTGWHPISQPSRSVPRHTIFRTRNILNCLTLRNIPTSQSSGFAKWNEVLQKIQRIQQYTRQAAMKSWTWPTGKRLAMSWTTTTPSASLTPLTLSPDIDPALCRRPGDAEAKGTNHF